MRFWFSSEVEHSVGSECGALQNKIEKALNDAVSATDYGTGVEAWAIIAIVLSDVSQAILNYGEVFRYHRKRKTIECRVQISYLSFLDASKADRLSLLARGIAHSFDKASGLAPKTFDVARLQRDFLALAWNAVGCAAPPKWLSSELAYHLAAVS